MFLTFYTDLGSAGSAGATNVATSASTGLTELLLTDIGLVIAIPLVFGIIYWAYGKINKVFGTSQA